MNTPQRSHKRATVYYRPGIGYFVINILATDRGLPLETELVGFVGEALAETEIWSCIVRALESFAKPISHADALAISEAWRRQHGFKSWRDLAKGSVSLSVEQTAHGYTVRRGIWDGRGFGSDPSTRREFPIDSPPKVVVACLSELAHQTE